MRLIDADALSEHKFVSIDCYLKSNVDNGFSRYKQGWNDAIDAIIDNALTVDFEKLGECLNCGIRAEYGSCDNCMLSCPRNELIELLDLDRPTGEWLEDSGNIACSHCHTIWLYRRTDFCPHCGADMRGGRDETN